MNQGKNVGFNFFQVRCAHRSGDVINFIILACRISSRLKWYKNYRNRLRLAKVIVKNKMSRFLWFTVCLCCYGNVITWWIENWRFARGGSKSAEVSRKRGWPPPIIFARIDRPMNAFFHTKKLCSRLSSSIVRFYLKNGQRLPLGDLGATYDVHLRLIGKHVVDFLLALTELFC